MRQEGIARLSSLDISRSRSDFLVMHFLIRDLRKAINGFASGKLLDIGCGNKPYESLFSNIESYTGSDVVQSDRGKVDVICEATNLPFGDEEFDTVFSTQVMEHVSDPFKMMEESWRVLRPGGHFILSVPFSWELHEEPYDFFRYSKYGLQVNLEKKGFEVVYIVPNGGKWAAIVQLNLNIIYSTFKRRGIISKLLKGIFINLRFTRLINHLALWMDNRYPDDLLTLNYVVVARKEAV